MALPEVVAYHTKRLAEQGCVELVKTARGRGGVTRIYRATVPFERDDDAWSTLPRLLQDSRAWTVIAEVAHDLRRAWQPALSTTKAST